MWSSCHWVCRWNCRGHYRRQFDFQCCRQLGQEMGKAFGFALFLRFRLLLVSLFHFDSLFTSRVVYLIAKLSLLYFVQAFQSIFLGFYSDFSVFRFLQAIFTNFFVILPIIFLSCQFNPLIVWQILYVKLKLSFLNSRICLNQLTISSAYQPSFNAKPRRMQASFPWVHQIILSSGTIFWMICIKSTIRSC